MTGTKPRYPLAEGFASISLNEKKFSIHFEDRTITLAGDRKDLESTIPKLQLKVKDLSVARKFSRVLSTIGVTFKLKDDKGIVFAVGKGIWTPLGHFSFKPRLRKYLGGR